MFAIAQHLRHIPVNRYRHRHQPTGSPLAERILLLYLPPAAFRTASSIRFSVSPIATRPCPNAIRLVDVPESLAQVLCRYIKGRKGHLFTTRAGRLLDSRNVLDVLQCEAPGAPISVEQPTSMAPS